MLSALLTALIIGLALGGYMELVAHQNNSTNRSLAWNGALPVAEGGIEEALTHLNDDTSHTANGWSATNVNGQTVYRKVRLFTSDGSKQVVTISNATANPVIFAKATVPGPVNKAPVSRVVKVTTTPKGQFGAGILTKNAINLGSDFLINSFDSTDPNYSTNGKYDKNKVKANGDLATVSPIVGQLQIADSDIYGHVYTTATGSYTLGKAGFVGDQAFGSNPANAGKVQAGHDFNDLNTTIPDAVPPAGWSSWPYPTGGTYNGVTYTYILYSGGYQLPSGTTLKGKILVLGNAKLYVPQNGRIQFGSGDVITINPALAATLEIHNASSTDVVMKDVSNDSGDATRFSYIGLPTTAGSKLTLTGSGAYAFAGTIYAPNQKVVMTGSSSGNEDFVGSITCDNFTMSGHSYMHYDEALSKKNGSPKVVIDSYAELSPSIEL